MSIVLSIIATLVSTGMLVLLGLKDPKRLRTTSKHAGRSSEAMSTNARRLLTAIALAPGLLLAFANAWQPFLVWLGATCTLAWLAVQLLSLRSERTIAR